MSKEGALMGMGSNEHGQLGVGDSQLQFTAKPTLISMIKDPLQLACGGECSYALTKVGSVYSWGRNDCGQLGFISVNVFSPTQVPLDTPAM